MKFESKVIDNKAQPLGNYPHVKRVGDFIYVSGTSSRRPDNTHEGVEYHSDGSVSLDISKQTKAVIENIAALLAEMDAGLEDLIDMTTFLVEGVVSSQFKTSHHIGFFCVLRPS